MQIFLLYLFLFLVGCLTGWVIELLFRRFVSAKKWVNPGFMKGPWLPLYGFGTIAMFTVCLLILTYTPYDIVFYNPVGGLFWREAVSGPTFADLIPISIMWISMVVLEFLAGLIFIKGFHVKLWDYTNMKGNILGIVCPVFSLIWLAVAVIFYYLIDPFLFDLSTNVYAYMFGDEGHIAHFGFLFAMGIVYGLMIYDCVVSIGLFSSITKFAKQTGILDRYESWKAKMDEEKKKIKLPEPPQSEAAAFLKEKLAEAIYIDPEKAKEKTSNYDENGRPIKTE